jgi:hypothetical protein
MMTMNVNQVLGRKTRRNITVGLDLPVPPTRTTLQMTAKRENEEGVSGGRRRKGNRLSKRKRISKSMGAMCTPERVQRESGM